MVSTAKVVETRKAAEEREKKGRMLKRMRVNRDDNSNGEFLWKTEREDRAACGSLNAPDTRESKIEMSWV